MYVCISIYPILYGVVVNVPNCNIVVSKFKIHLYYYIPFWTNYCYVSLTIQLNINHLFTQS